jgi:tetratricopeptide (TPR) repeat protein
MENATLSNENATLNDIVAAIDPLGSAQAAGRDVEATKARLRPIVERARTDKDYAAAVALLKQGKSAEAEGRLRAALAEMAARREADLKAEAQGWVDVGTIAGYGDPRRALDAYTNALRLDPDNSDALARAGELEEDMGDLATSERNWRHLAELPAGKVDGDLTWQAHIGLGDIARDRGDLSQALAEYRAGLGIAERLAGQDANNAGWQRDLSVSHEKIGDVLVAQGQLAEALAEYRAGLGTAARLAGLDANNADWQRDLSVSHAKLAVVYRRNGDRANALAHLTAGRAIIADLVAKYPDWVQWKQDLAWFDGQLAELK